MSLIPSSRHPLVISALTISLCGGIDKALRQFDRNIGYLLREQVKTQGAPGVAIEDPEFLALVDAIHEGDRILWEREQERRRELIEKQSALTALPPRLQEINHGREVPEPRPSIPMNSRFD